MIKPVIKPRNLYLKRIEPHIQKNYIKVLTGLPSLTVHAT